MTIRSISLSMVALACAGIAGYGAMYPASALAGDMQMKTDKDIIDVATGAGMEKVTTLVKAVQAAGLVDTLKGPGPFTVFAPTDEAFAKIPKATLVAGYEICKVALPKGTYERYLGIVQTTAVAAATAGLNLASRVVRLPASRRRRPP